MSGTTKNLESSIASLCQKAEDLGAAQAVAIPVTDIVVDERVLLKCMVPLCSHYGELMCPPNVLPMSKFKEILNCYHRAILIKVDIPLNDLPEGIRGRGEQPAAPTAEDYLNTARDVQKRLHEIVCRVESLCFEGGHRFAAGIIGGPCPLCEECVGIKSGLPCRHPFRARPGTDAMGIDVMATAEKAGLHLNFARGGSRSWVGVVLVA